MGEELNKDTIIAVLKQPKPLSVLLSPAQFAARGQVADELASQFLKKKEMKVTQLRKFFHTLKEKERMEGGKGEEAELDKKTRDAIFLYLPDLAYARGRKLIPQKFYELMCLCLDPQRLNTVGDLKTLINFLTALLAYYKYREKEKEGGNV